MAKKRPSGEGSVYRRKRDGRWVAALTLGWTEGKQKRKEFVGQTRGEVVQRLRQALQDLDQGKPVKFENITVGAFLARWLEDVVRVKNADATLERSYTWAVDTLTAGLGRVPLAKLTTYEVQRFLNEVRKKKLPADGSEPEPLGAKSKKNVRDTLRAALNVAVEWGWVPRNVVAGRLIKLPKVKSEGRVWSVAEVNRFVRSTTGHRWEALFRLALYLGMREGEMLALTWSNIDFAKGYLWVRESQARAQGVLVSKEPKTESSYRRLPLVLDLADSLRRRKEAQAIERDAEGPTWRDTGHVFTTGKGTRLDASNFLKAYKREARKAGLDDLPPQAARRTTASLLLEAGLNEQEISTILGHSSPRTTETYYTKPTPDSEARVERTLRKIFKEANSKEAVRKLSTGLTEKPKNR